MKTKIESSGKTVPLNGLNWVKIKNLGLNSVWICLNGNHSNPNPEPSKCCHEIVPDEQITITNMPIKDLFAMTLKNQTSEISFEAA